MQKTKRLLRQNKAENKPKTPEFRCASWVTAKNFTPLMHAVMKAGADNCFEVKQVLNKMRCEQGTNRKISIDKTNSIGWTALMLAVVNSRTQSSDKCVRLLLSHGANPNGSINVHNSYPLLHLACMWNASAESIRLLFKYGADRMLNRGGTSGDCLIEILIGEYDDISPQFEHLVVLFKHGCTVSDEYVRNRLEYYDQTIIPRNFPNLWDSKLIYSTLICLMKAGLRENNLLKTNRRFNLYLSDRKNNLLHRITYNKKVIESCRETQFDPRINKVNIHSDLDNFKLFDEITDLENKWKNSSSWAIAYRHVYQNDDLLYTMNIASNNYISLLPTEIATLLIDFL